MNTESNDHNMPLLEAVLDGRFGMIERLVNAGCSITRETPRGDSALSQAYCLQYAAAPGFEEASRNRKRILEYLLKKSGASSNFSNKCRSRFGLTEDQRKSLYLFYQRCLDERKYQSGTCREKVAIRYGISIDEVDYIHEEGILKDWPT